MDSKNWCLSHLYSIDPNPRDFRAPPRDRRQNFKPPPRTRQFPVPAALGWIKPRAIIRSLWAIRIALKEKPRCRHGLPAPFPPGIFGHSSAARLTGATQAIVQLRPAAYKGNWSPAGISTDIPSRPPNSCVVRPASPFVNRSSASSLDAVIVRGRKGCRIRPPKRQSGLYRNYSRQRQSRPFRFASSRANHRHRLPRPHRPNQTTR